MSAGAGQAVEDRVLAVAFLAVWAVGEALALAGTFTGLIWIVPWWTGVYAAPVVTWVVGGLWW